MNHTDSNGEIEGGVDVEVNAAYSDQRCSITRVEFMSFPYNTSPQYQLPCFALHSVGVYCISLTAGRNNALLTN